MNTENLNEVLLDVRKAYRLIFQFQQRILELSKFIGDTFSFLKYSGGHHWFGEGESRNGKGSLSDPSWNYLPFYMIELKFQEKRVNGTSFNFSVVVEADSGYFDSSHRKYQDTASFESPSDSHSLIILMLGRNCAWDLATDDIKNDDFDLYKKTPCEYKKLGKKDQMFLAKSYRIQEFFNLESTTKALEDFERFCSINGIEEIKASL